MSPSVPLFELVIRALPPRVSIVDRIGISRGWVNGTKSVPFWLARAPPAEATRTSTSSPSGSITARVPSPGPSTTYWNWAVAWFSHLSCAVHSTVLEPRESVPTDSRCADGFTSRPLSASPACTVTVALRLIT